MNDTFKIFLEVYNIIKNITGVFINMMKEKIENACGDEKQMLEKALYIGLEALLTGKVDIS